MKSFNIATLLAFVVAVAASPTPQKTITVVPIPAAASPYPAGPTANEFKYENYDENSQDDKDKRTKVHDAFASEWAGMLQKGFESLANTEDKTFEQWFPQEVEKKDGSKMDARGYVSGVWRQMLQPDQNKPAPRAIVANFVNDKIDYGKNGKGNCGGATRAYTSPDTGRFHVCDKGLEQITKASDVQCSELGDLVSTKMSSLTATLVHEFHHSVEVGDKATNSVGHIRDVGYGPSTCHRARGDQRVFLNADSYKWFAVHAYYNSKCGKTFGPPEVTTEDYEEGELELMESPEYDAGLASGFLAGV